LKKALTVKGIEAAKPQASRYEIADAILPGFVAVVHPTGKKTWAYPT
jgi:hypothetical protein